MSAIIGAAVERPREGERLPEVELLHAGLVGRGVTETACGRVGEVVREAAGVTCPACRSVVSACFPVYCQHTRLKRSQASTLARMSGRSSVVVWVGLYGWGGAVELAAAAAAAGFERQVRAGRVPGRVDVDVSAMPSTDHAADTRGTLYFDVLTVPGLMEPPPQELYRWAVEVLLSELGANGRLQVQHKPDDSVVPAVCRGMAAALVALRQSGRP